MEKKNNLLNNYRYGNLPSFAGSIVTEIARVDDTKPGVLSRLLLPILQAHIYVAPFCLPVKVIYL